jgi:hypothetical protein
MKYPPEGNGPEKFGPAFLIFFAASCIEVEN